MLATAYAHQFKKDWKKLKASGKNIDIVKWVMEELTNERQLPTIYDDHPLHGPWIGHRSCHPQSDTPLIYFVAKGKITFERIGSHAELYE